MQNPVFIAGDWGNSNLRLYLCEIPDQGSAVLLDSRSGPGVQQIENDFDRVFFSLCGDWLETHGNVAVILSGAVGSNIGWRHTPYLSCPVDATDIAAGCVQFVVRGISVSLLSGIKTRNPLGTSDVMRGEELQLLGWLQQQAPDNRKHCLMILPGTHNKWLLVTDGQLETFLTAYTGELFSLLRQHSILISESHPLEIDQNAFISGVEAIEEGGDAHLVHTLFATRSKQLLEEMSTTDASSYLSGLIIGADVMGAVKIFSSQAASLPPIVIIGEHRLANLYSLTLNRMAIEATCFDATDIALSGYTAVHQSLFRQHN